jgi:replicative DNA helicase
MLGEPNRDNRFNGVRHLTLTVAKNRHGDQGSVPLVFNPLVCDIREETAGEGR